MSFYNFLKNEASGGDELHIDGEIASEESWWGPMGQVVARRFRQRLSMTGDVTVYINSPGGDVFAGAEIYTALREHSKNGKGKVTVKVSGIAASAASVIAMAGDEVLMSPVAYMMIHDPWTFAAGNAREMEHQAAVLKEVGEGLIAAYTAKTGKSRDEVVGMLAAETYMSAQRAVDEGFADGILYEEAPKPTGKDGKDGKPAAQPARTLMKASRYGPSAICAMIGQAVTDGIQAGLNGQAAAAAQAAQQMTGAAQPDQDAARRAEIAQRALLMAQIYHGY